MRKNLAEGLGYFKHNVPRLATNLAFLAGLSVSTQACLEVQENTQESVASVLANSREQAIQRYTLEGIQPPQGQLRFRMKDSSTFANEESERSIDTDVRDPYNPDIYYTLETLANYNSWPYTFEYSLIQRDFETSEELGVYATGEETVATNHGRGFVNLEYGEIDFSRGGILTQFKPNSLEYTTILFNPYFNAENIYLSGDIHSLGILDGYMILHDSSMQNARLFAIDPETKDVAVFNATPSFPQSVNIQWGHHLSPKVIMFKTNYSRLLAKSGVDSQGNFSIQFWNLKDLVEAGIIQTDPEEYEMLKISSCGTVFCKNSDTTFMLTLEDAPVVIPEQDAEVIDAEILDFGVIPIIDAEPIQDATPIQDTQVQQPIEDANIQDSEPVVDAEPTQDAAVDSTLDSDIQQPEVDAETQPEQDSEIQQPTEDAEPTHDTEPVADAEQTQDIQPTPDATSQPQQDMAPKTPKQPEEADSGTSTPPTPENKSSSADSGCSVANLSTEDQENNNFPDPTALFLVAAAVAIRVKKALR